MSEYKDRYCGIITIVLNKALDALAELHEQYKLSGECVIHNNNEIDTKYPLKLRVSTPTIEN